jgi:hypothetical protein
MPDDTPAPKTTIPECHATVWVEGFLEGLGGGMACECPYPWRTFQRGTWAAGFVVGRARRNVERKAAWKAAPL